MPVTICARCGLAHENAVPKDDPIVVVMLQAKCGLPECVVAQAAAMLAMLKNVGQPGICRGCPAKGYWVTHYNGKATFYTEAGLNHFVDCPAAKRFKKEG